MHLFDEAEPGQTRKRFWAVFAAVSGFTYLTAAAGLSGVSLSLEDWKDWRQRWKLKARRSRERADEEKGGERGMRPEPI